MKAQASDLGVYHTGWPTDLYWFTSFSAWLDSEKGKRINFARHTEARVRRCLWWVCQSGPQASQVPPQFDVQMLTQDTLTAFRDYLTNVGFTHSTVRIWFQAIRLYLDWLANWPTLSDNKDEEYRLNRLTGIVKSIIAGTSSKTTGSSGWREQLIAIGPTHHHHARSAQRQEPERRPC